MSLAKNDFGGASVSKLKTDLYLNESCSHLILCNFVKKRKLKVTLLNKNLFLKLKLVNCLVTRAKKGNNLSPLQGIDPRTS